AGLRPSGPRVTGRSLLTSGRSSTGALAPASASRSCAKPPSGPAATGSAPSSTKSAISLSSPSNPSKPHRWRGGRGGAWLIGLALSAALLVWVLYKIDPRKVWTYAEHANGWLLFVTVVLATLTFPVRTIRWRLILRDAKGERFPITPLWHATTIGFMANNLLPARAGEVARAYVASGQLPVRAADRVLHASDGIVEGLAVLKSPARFAGVVFWSLVLWITNAAAFAICFRAFGLAVPLEAALLLQGIIGFGVAVPSTPSFLGIFEAATLVTLQLYGVESSLAVSYALTYHLTTFLPITLLGLW